MKTDIEISHSVKLEDIEKIAKKAKINKIEKYGNYKAKIDFNINSKKQGKLILVTSTNPTPYGEGKTTMTIGINDALRRLGLNSLAVLREPSLGPVFGIKGGATGGGYSQVVPMEDINLHFTGDMHAIENANNLLCAAIDNHIFQGNELNIDKIVFNRCMDMNDRALRNITLNGKIPREDKFNITVASEIMAILCLCDNLDDLKKRISNIHIGYDINGKPLFARDLKIADAMTILLKDAIKPNLVQSLENNPVVIHGGPFANIAHGCNSLIATKLSLKLADYVITEAGFGADLGAEKFLDIKCRVGDLTPNVIVLNTTVRSLKYNGDSKETNELEKLKQGIKNLKVHMENMKKYLDNVIVCLNRFEDDKEEEIKYIEDYCKKHGFEFSANTSFKDGSKGATDLASKIVKLCDKKSNFKLLYDEKDSIKNKIKKVSKEIYHASSVKYEEKASENIKNIEKMNSDKLPICIAKTQYSISDDPKKLGYPKDYEITVRDVKLCSGAGFIVVYLGNIMTMPGLSKNPSYLNMKIDSFGNISGLY